MLIRYAVVSVNMQRFQVGICFLDKFPLCLGGVSFLYATVRMTGVKTDTQVCVAQFFNDLCVSIRIPDGVDGVHVFYANGHICAADVILQLAKRCQIFLAAYILGIVLATA